MAFEYTIAAIPTEYNGRCYRSRLEARWAAFFDLLGWQHEYEPFDLGSWSPDFLITSTNKDSIYALVEIKPLVECDDETVKRMIGACRAHRILDANGAIQHAILFGLSPVDRGPAGVLLGWGIQEWDAQPFRKKNHILTWGLHDDRPALVADIISTSDAEAYTSVLLNRGFHRNRRDNRFYNARSMDLWARATNLVKYQVGD